MTVKTSWPWIAGLVTLAAIFNPLGLAVINATFTGEQLARSIGQMLFFIGLGGVVALALVEFGIRKYLMYRRRRRDTADA
jgi:hypothetical protein